MCCWLNPGRLCQDSCFRCCCNDSTHICKCCNTLGLQAVELFLEEKIGYLDIVKTVEAACDAHQKELVERPSLEEIVHYDAWARRHVAEAHGSRQAVLA